MINNKLRLLAKVTIFLIVCHQTKGVNFIWIVPILFLFF